MKLLKEYAAANGLAVAQEYVDVETAKQTGRAAFGEMVASHADERREHEEAIKRHQAEHKRLQDRINAMYVDKLDGLVETAFYNRMVNQVA